MVLRKRACRQLGPKAEHQMLDDTAVAGVEQLGPVLFVLVRSHQCIAGPIAKVEQERQERKKDRAGTRHRAIVARIIRQAFCCDAR